MLDALSKHVVETNYDVKQLIRAIAKSRTYQLSSKPNATNEKDEINYSRALPLAQGIRFEIEAQP